MARLNANYPLVRSVSEAEQAEMANDLIRKINACESMAALPLAEVLVLCEPCEQDVNITVATINADRLSVRGVTTHVRNFRRLSNGGVGVTCPTGHTIEPTLTDATWWMVEKHLAQIEDAKLQHPAGTAHPIQLVQPEAPSTEASAVVA